MDKTGFIREFNVTAYTLKGCVHCLHLHELLERSIFHKNELHMSMSVKTLLRKISLRNFPKQVVIHT
ncbi:MAG: hypothetical protein CM15mV4_0950 [Caudoviricetes sp.]|nr:MAG: hypothetical protein CM15mV4_0950 [Caudoviricetes sp.]